MVFLPEKDVKNAVRRLDIPVLFNPCPANGETERESMKDLLADLDYKYRGVKERIFGAIERSNLSGWEKVTDKNRKKKSTLSSVLFNLKFS